MNAALKSLVLSPALKRVVSHRRSIIPALTSPLVGQRDQLKQQQLRYESRKPEFFHFKDRKTTGLRALTNSDNGLKAFQEELKEEVKQEEVVSDGKKVVCEFVLQALFNFLSVSSVAMAVKNSGGDPTIQTLMVMGSHAVILPLVIYSGIEISGAHFNPVVTACFVLIKKMSVKLGLAYVAAQLAGGVIGAAAAFSSLPSSMQSLAYAGIQAVPATSTVQQAFMGEIYAAFAFIFVLFGTNVHPRGWGKLKPLSIPMIICLLMWLVGPVSSMCINPARAFGPALVTGFWDNHWIWWTAPFIGGLSAASLYQNVFLAKKISSMLAFATTSLESTIRVRWGPDPYIGDAS